MKHNGIKIKKCSERIKILISIDKLSIERHSRRGLLHIGVEHTEYHRLFEYNVRVLRQRAESVSNVLVVAEIYLLWQEKTLLHRNRKISNSLYLFITRLFVKSHAELGNPHRVYVFLIVLHNVVKHKIQKYKQLDSHQLVILSLHKEKTNLRVIGRDNVNVLFGINWGFKHQQLIFYVHSVHPFVVQHGCVHFVRNLQFGLQNGQQQSIVLSLIVEVVPVIFLVRWFYFVFNFDIQVLNVEAFSYG